MSWSAICWSEQSTWPELQMSTGAIDSTCRLPGEMQASRRYGHAKKPMQEKPKAPPPPHPQPFSWNILWIMVQDFNDLKPNRCDSNEWHEEAIRGGRKEGRRQKNKNKSLLRQTDLGSAAHREQLSLFDKCTWSAACHVVTAAQCFTKVQVVRAGHLPRMMSASSDIRKYKPTLQRNVPPHPPPTHSIWTWSKLTNRAEFICRNRNI